MEEERKVGEFTPSVHEFTPSSSKLTTSDHEFTPFVHEFTPSVQVMYLAVRETSPLAALYFISMLLIGNFVLLNLFLAAVVETCSQVRTYQDRKIKI